MASIGTKISELHQCSLDDYYNEHTFGSKVLDLGDVTLQPGDTYEDLYQNLMQFTEDILMTRTCGITHHGKPVKKDEVLTPTLENVVCCIWLHSINPSLPKLVKLKYGTELRKKSLASIRVDISATLSSLLDELLAPDDLLVSCFDSPIKSGTCGQSYKEEKQPDKRHIMTFGNQKDGSKSNTPTDEESADNEENADNDGVDDCASLNEIDEMSDTSMSSSVIDTKDVLAGIKNEDGSVRLSNDTKDANVLNTEFDLSHSVKIESNEMEMTEEEIVREAHEDGFSSSFTMNINNPNTSDRIPSVWTPCKSCGLLHVPGNMCPRKMDPKYMTSAPTGKGRFILHNDGEMSSFLDNVSHLPSSPISQETVREPANSKPISQEIVTVTNNSQTNNSTYSCNICPYKNDSMYNLQRHLKTHSNKRLSCQLCQKEYSQMGDLKDHVKMVHKEEGNICHACGKLFKSRRGLEEHVKSHYQTQTSFICETCGKVFARKIHLQTHVNTAHLKLKPFICTVESCLKAYGSESARNRHMAVNHGSPSFICNLCGSTFALKYALKEHTESVHKGVSYRCECGKKFKHRQSLQRHAVKHGHQKK